MDKTAFINHIRTIHGELPAKLAKQTMQPKYNPAKVGPIGENGKPLLDQYGLPKDFNVVKTMSLDNFDHAQRFGVVIDQYVYAALPRIANGMCRLATDEEILEAENRGREFQQEADAIERANRRGKYKNLTLAVA